MIDADLPAGPGSPLVRGVAACLSSVTEVPLADLPHLADDEPLAHALGAWRGWLAGRGSGLVPVADPRTFAWPGWWIAVAEHAGGQVAVLAFGTPPGVVLSPQDPALLGRATADLDLAQAWVVAPLDPVLEPLPAAVPLRGAVAGLAVADDAGAPVRTLDAAEALAGRGLDGDRYARGAGTFSPRAAHRPGYDLTLVAAEVLDDLGIAFARTRRNVLTRGVDVNALVGREFLLGEALCVGRRLAEPCAHLERLGGPGLLRPLVHRAGLRADVLRGGPVAVGDALLTT